MCRVKFMSILKVCFCGYSCASVLMVEAMAAEVDLHTYEKKKDMEVKGRICRQ